MSKTGILSVVGTPIGNLDDMSFRGVKTLKEADLIAAEDTRHTIKLLNHFEIHTKMTAYHKFNEREASEKLIPLLLEGENIALVSDAGMPVVSDPGYILVAECRKMGIPVTVVPGPSASVCAVAMSGIDCRHFTFYGFLGKSNREIREGIESIAASRYPVILYETPHRLVKTLEKLAEKIPERNISISREITKQHEENRFGTAGEHLTWFEEHPPKGEFVLVIECGTKEENSAGLNYLSIDEHVKYYIGQGLSEKDAMKAAAKDRGVGKREIYEAYKINK